MNLSTFLYLCRNYNDLRIKNAKNLVIIFEGRLAECQISMDCSNYVVIRFEIKNEVLEIFVIAIKKEDE